MSTIGAWVLAYLVTGIVISELANHGSWKSLGYGLSKVMYLCGVILWLPMLVIGYCLSADNSGDKQ